MSVASGTAEAERLANSIADPLATQTAKLIVVQFDRIITAPPNNSGSSSFQPTNEPTGIQSGAADFTVRIAPLSNLFHFLVVAETANSVSECGSGRGRTGGIG
jgi:hypothetical protein